MCGIVGIVVKDGTAQPSVLERMMPTIAHRGPDGTGRVIENNVVLGHTRLAIIDLETGEHPIINRQGDQLIANGEIYNYLELRRNLGLDQFKTRSDCEAPLILFQREGKNFAKYLRGMYAVTILEGRSGEIYLSRDRFGIKPLYISKFEDGLCFASEITALVRSGIIKPVLNAVARGQLLQHQFTHGKSTVIEGVERVMPGETIRIIDGSVAERQQLEALPKEGPANWSEEEAIRLLDKVLMDSVTVHQRSDVPYGLFLSGGVDSSAILACMRELNDRPVETFAAGFSGTEVSDERAHAKSVAKAAGANFHAVEFDEGDFWNYLPKVVACLDDPTSDYATLPTFKLGALAKEHGLKVVLSGEGGDELFAGYGRYRRLLRPWWLGGRKMRQKGIFEGTNIIRQYGIPNMLSAIDYPAHRYRTRLQNAQAIDCANWLPNDLLIKLDRCLMIHGVEGRTPFLDLEVAEIAMRLPDSLKIKNNLGKYVLRQWLERKLPEAKPLRPKQGFTVPVAEWISRKSKLTGELIAKQPCIEEIANISSVRALFSRLDGTTNRKAGQMAWSLLFYALWHRYHIDGRACDGDVFDCLSQTN